MKNKIAFAVTTCGLGMTAIGIMGAGTEERTGFVMAMMIALIGLAVAGSGVLIEKTKIKKSVPLWKSSRPHSQHR